MIDKRILDEGDQRRLRGLLDEGEIVGEPRHQLPGRLPGDARIVGIDQMGERRLLDVGDHAQHDARGGHLMQVQEQAARRR